MNQIDQAQKSESRPVTEIAAAILLAVGLFSLYLSFAFYALNWRVANEPGFDTNWWLLGPAIALCSVGGLLFVGTHLYLLMRRSRLIWLGWGLCLASTICAATLAPLLLMLMA